MNFLRLIFPSNDIRQLNSSYWEELDKVGKDVLQLSSSELDALVHYLSYSNAKKFIAFLKKPKINWGALKNDEEFKGLLRQYKGSSDK